MTPRHATGYAPPLLLMLGAVVFTAMTGAFSPAARAVPRLIGGAVLVLCTLDILSRSATAAGRLVAGWLNPAGLKAEAAADGAMLLRQTRAVFAVLALTAGLALSGILPSVAVFGMAAFHYGARQSWLRSAGIAAAVVLAVWLLFSVALGLSLFPGVLFGGAW